MNGGQLEQHGPEPLAQRAGRLAQARQAVGDVGELLLVRDAARALERELEPGGRLGGPLAEHLGRGHPVEGVVDLDGVEALGVVREHLRRGELLGVEAALPGRVAEAAGADEIRMRRWAMSVWRCRGRVSSGPLFAMSGAPTGKLPAMAKRRVANPFEDTTRMSPAPGPQAGEGNAAYLVVLAGSNVGRDVQGRQGAHHHGARRAASTSACSTRASRASTPRSCRRRATRHANILEDMGSTNGTFCNGTRVQRQVLADGDKILLGSTTILKFSYQDKLDEMFQRQMSESALRDGLTKTFNKRYFSERLESEYLYAVRHDAPLSLLFLDIDHFKRINDVHGHPAGDYVLVELAEARARVRCATRTSSAATAARSSPSSRAAPSVADGADAGRAAAPGRRGARLLVRGQADRRHHQRRRRARAARWASARPPSSSPSPTRPCTRPSARAATASACASPDGEPTTKAAGSGPVEASYVGEASRAGRGRRAGGAGTRRAGSSSRPGARGAASAPARRAA